MPIAGFTRKKSERRSAKMPNRPIQRGIKARRMEELGHDVANFTVHFALLLLITALSSTSVAAACELKQDSGSTPAVWLFKRGHSYLYLLGSVHSLPEGSFPFGPGVRRAFHYSYHIYMEIRPNSFSVRHMNEYAIGKAKLKGLQQTEELMTKATALRANALLQRLGFDQMQIHLYKPWYWLLKSLSYYSGRNNKVQAQFGVEQLLTNGAINGNRILHGLEKPTDLVDRLDRLSYKTQGILLVQALQHALETRQKAAKLICAWRNGDEKSLSTHTAQVRETYPRYYDFMVAQRNRAWEPHLDSLLQGDRVTLVIVGFNHLYGPQGLLAHFRNISDQAWRIQ